ncbi:MATE family efflux transporter [Streptomyces sp. NBC_01237]|uniref:MATE family efflux transporter n=1 Tax=Streptomyces sp. NBC_01237 TaxID=2903790 RepID=UPI002DD9CF2E|nr:MATE family efflux transporter [Streptomyces sp. NBC_01237]WRZ77392.1 MATE family efflux transporter [Streptomyces sp. NBC_01237]
MTSTATAADHTTRLGTEPVGRLLRRACVQTTGAVGVYGIYALTNAWFVGYGVGETAMAAVNLVAPLLLLLGAVSTTVGAGGASLISRALGAGDRQTAARAAGNTLTLFWISAAATTTLGLAFLDPLLSLLGAHGELRESARPYAVVLLAGALVSTGFSSLVRAEGRMGYSTLLWVVPVAVQITLDPLLIFGLDMGVQGAALGTVGGQAVSAAMSLWFFFGQRDRPYRIGPRELLPHRATLRALLGIGLPSFLAGTGVTLLAVLVNATLAATGSATALAAYAVCVRLQTFVMMPHTGVSQGLQPIVGYNAGRGLADRALRARNLALAASLLYGLLTATVLAFLGRPIAGWFLSGADTIATAGQALQVIALGLAVAGIAPLVAAYAQSLGRPAPAYLISTGTLLLIKIPLLLILGRLGTGGVWAGLAAGELATAAVALLLLRRLGGPTRPARPRPRPGRCAPTSPPR